MGLARGRRLGYATLMRLTTAFAVLALLASPPVRAEEKKSPAAAPFERLKALAGTWTGKVRQAGAAEETIATVTWRVTSGGSAVMETIDPGSPHEMVTLYHLDGDQLLLTHYCAAGNQPTMRAAKSADPRTLTFEFVRGTNMKPPDLHMRSVRITFVDEARTDTEWTSWKGGKPVGTMRFELSRQR